MKTLKKIWVHFGYWITFLIIPFLGILIKIITPLASFFIDVYSEIHGAMKEQWRRYLKYIELSK